METKLFTEDSIKEAGELLRQGELIAFPTETVYGLGAVASCDESVREVYRVKGRPSDNPLIVHVAEKDISAYVEHVPELAAPLIEAFWPGPLTLIFPAKEGVFAPTVTAGHSTVALRMPDQPLTLRLIEACGSPIVGPSANLSGKPSPTTASHVYHDMQGKIAGIVDGGTTHIGVESTVLDLTDSLGPVILRPGAITAEDMELVLQQPIRVGKGSGNGADAPKAPGMKYRHYSPKQPVILMEGTLSDWSRLLAELVQKGRTFGILASEETIAQLQVEPSAGQKTVYSLGRRDEPLQASHHLYAGLRYFDEQDVDFILAEAYPIQGVGGAFMNRLTKASTWRYPEEAAKMHV